jgi:hypothetical protein
MGGGNFHSSAINPSHTGAIKDACSGHLKALTLFWNEHLFLSSFLT